MNKSIIITAFLFLSFNGFAQLKKVGTVKRIVLTHHVVSNNSLESLLRAKYIAPPSGTLSAAQGCIAVHLDRGYQRSILGLFSLPQQNINAIANTFAGVISVNGAMPNIKGARADGTAYFIDGVRVYHFEP